MHREIERAPGRDGAFADLPRGDRNDAGIGAIEHGGLLGIGLKTEFCANPGRRRERNGYGVGNGIGQGRQRARHRLRKAVGPNLTIAVYDYAAFGTGIGSADSLVF